MAKGTFTFEFESLADLQRQMWAALGPMSLMADAAAKGLCPQPVQADAARTLPAGTVYYSDGREPTHIPATQATAFEPAKAPTGDHDQDAAAALVESGKTLRRLVEEQTKAEQAENDRRLDLAVASGRPFVPLGSDVAAQQAAQLATTILTGDPSTPIGEMSPTPPTATEETTPTPEPEKAPETVTETLTLETLADAPYPELLAFCERNPGVGVDVAKSQPAFFRKFVEMKVKTYLETK